MYLLTKVPGLFYVIEGDELYHAAGFELYPNKIDSDLR
jgi:hypothetical protein